MSDAKYVIVGGGLAAAHACEGIREVDESGSIIIIGTEPHLPYNRPPLSKAYLRGERRRARIFVHPEAYYAEHGITVMREAEAVRITRRSRKVTLENGESVGYEKLLLATGGRAWRLPLSGADLPGVYTLRTVDDCDAIKKAAKAASRVLVIGGSFIGCEVSASLSQLGVPVSMCFLEEYPLQAVMARELGEHVRDILQEAGVEVFPSTRPERIEGETRVERVRLENGMVIEADMVIMGVGIRLNTQLARDAELDLTDASGIVVDEHLRTSDPHIYAAGDIAAWPDPYAGMRVRVEHWDVASNQGHAAGRNMAGAADPYDVLTYFFSDILDLSLEAWGDIGRWDDVLVRGSLSAGSVSYWYVKDGRIAGALAIGLEDADREAAQALVKARPARDEVETALTDPDVSLDTLL